MRYSALGPEMRLRNYHLEHCVACDKGRHHVDTVQ